MSSLNDVISSKLKLLGYMGSFNDMEKAFWENLVGGLPNPDGTSFYSGRTGLLDTTADGLTLEFSVAHGLPKIPVYASMIGRNTNSGGEKFVTWDATNIIVTYLIAPAPGALTFNWIGLV